MSNNESVVRAKIAEIDRYLCEGKTIQEIKNLGYSWYRISPRSKLLRATGKIPPKSYPPPQLTEFDRGWIIGIIDSEGYLGIVRFHNKKKHKTHYSCKISIGMTNKEIIHKLKLLTGFGSIYQEIIRNTQMWYWNAQAKGLRALLPLIVNDLIEKKQQAILILKALAMQHPSGHYHNDELRRLGELSEEIKKLNSGKAKVQP